MNENAVQLNDSGKKNINLYILSFQELRAKLQLIEQAIELEPKFEEAWYNKGIIHFRLSELAEAAVAFERVLLINPQHQFAPHQINLIKKVQFGHIENNKSKRQAELQNELIAYYQSVCCKKEYQEEFRQLCEKHQQIKKLDFSAQVDWVLELMGFIYKYYDPNPKIYPFLEPTLLENSARGRNLRLKFFGNHQARYTQLECNGNFAEGYEALFDDILPELGHVIYHDDSKTVLRMIFETIHQFSREERSKYVGKLPWGPNSWYFLEFCASIFLPDSVIDSDVGITITLDHLNQLSDMDKDCLFQYQKSMQDNICLVKVLIPLIINHDLKLLQGFFKSIQQSLQLAPQTVTVNDLQELPNLKDLLWYQKHSFHYLRMQAILPKSLNAMTISVCEDRQKFKSNNRKHLPLNQLQLLDYQSDFIKSIKSRLATLRRFQLIGEIFTKRSWGNHLDTLRFVNPDALSNLRNGLSHLEDLGSFDIVRQLEQNEKLIHDLYIEYNTFRHHLFKEIAIRQSKFPVWPDTCVKFEVWKPELVHYWDAVKKYYAPRPTFNPFDFVPHQKLIADHEIDLLKKAWAGDQSELDQLIQSLEGERPYIAPKFDELESKLASAYQERKNLSAIKKIFTLAEKKYKRLKQEEKDNIAQRNRQYEQQLKSDREDVMKTHYPTISLVSSSLVNELNQSHKMSIKGLIDCLKDRISVVKIILDESKIDICSNNQLRKDIHKSIVKDVELFFSLSYLIPQIISLFNKLNSIQALDLINPELKKYLANFVALRNALEHSDPIIESEAHSYVQMKSKIPEIMAAFIDELLTNHSDKLLKVNSDEIENNFSLSNSICDMVKQDKPLSLNRRIFLMRDTGSNSSSCSSSPTSPSISSPSDSPLIFEVDDISNIYSNSFQFFPSQNADDQAEEDENLIPTNTKNFFD